jgi:hypothetical protein
VAKELTVSVGHSQLDAPDLIHTIRGYITAERLEHANLDRLIGRNGHAAHFIGTFKGRGCTLAGGKPDDPQNE